MQIPFGKYRGEEIEDVPYSYLVWAEENVDNMDKELRDAINWEISRRGSDVTSRGRIVAWKKDKFK